MTPYPSEFYTAHALFTGAPFRAGGEWGSITDGPVDFHGLRMAILDHCTDAPTRSTLRVWHFPGDAAPREVTEDVIAVLSGCWDEPEMNLADWESLSARADRDHAMWEAA